MKWLFLISGLIVTGLLFINPALPEGQADTGVNATFIVK